MIECPSCGSSRTAEVGPIPADNRFAGRVLDELIGGGTLVVCHNCHLRFRWPQPSPERLRVLYEAANPASWQYDPSARVDWSLARDYVLQRTDISTVLDVGCFDGAFLATLPSRLTKAGIEPSPHAAQIARNRGIEIVSESAEDIPRQWDARFDVVTAFDVLEHLSAPASFVVRVRDLLRPGGVLIVATGSTDALSWRVMGSRYWYCAIPEHLSFINEAWIQHVARDNGLRVEYKARYAHEPAGVARRARQTINNLFYLALPKTSARLRAAGMGGLDVRTHPELKEYPPQWMTARDHILAILRR